MILFGLICISIIMIAFTIAFFIAQKPIEKVQLVISFNTLVIVFLMLLLVYTNNAVYMDIVLLYALLSFTSTLAISKYLKINLKNNNPNK